MPPLLLISTITITAALVFYTIGVWSERLAQRLKPWHLVMFWLGFICDTVGTALMGEIAGGMQFNLHGLTGLLAIGLMLAHAAWATVVLLRKDEQALRVFHHFSLFVWLVWLVPYFSGVVMGMWPKA